MFTWLETVSVSVISSVNDNSIGSPKVADVKDPPKVNITFEKNKIRPIEIFMKFQWGTDTLIDDKVFSALL